MKLLLIIPSFYPATIYGGPIFSTLHTCESLSRVKDFNIFVSTTNANMTKKLDVEYNKWILFNGNFFVKYYNELIIGKFSLSFFLNIWNDIRAAEVVHIQSIFNTTTPISLLWAVFFKKPTLLSPRGSLCKWGLSQSRLFKLLWLIILIKPFNSSIYWHATGTGEKNDILTCFPCAKVLIVPNGIEINRFSDANYLEKIGYIKKFVGVKSFHSKIIVSMGRLHQKKGFDILIKAFLEVSRVYNDAILLIAGNDAGEKAKLDKLVKENTLNKNVFFVGEVSGQDKVDFLANADLFVLPSYNENFGNVYIESLAAGTPIVASKDTPWQEVEMAECGKWVDNTVEDTSKAMLNLLEKDRVVMRENSKAFAKKYDWENIALQFEELFKDLT